MKNFIRRFHTTIKVTGTLTEAGLFSFILYFFSPLMAQGTSDEQASFDFAQSLFKDTSYANAAQEFRQFIVHFPTSERMPLAMLRLGESYFLSEQFRERMSLD